MTDCRLNDSTATAEDIVRARWPTARHAKGLVMQLRYLLSISVCPSND